MDSSVMDVQQMYDETAGVHMCMAVPGEGLQMYKELVVVQPACQPNDYA
jgi:hypothetical protein